jgi:hypothetical protein
MILAPTAVPQAPAAQPAQAQPAKACPYILALSAESRRPAPDPRTSASPSGTQPVALVLTPRGVHAAVSIAEPLLRSIEWDHQTATVRC